MMKIGFGENVVTVLGEQLKIGDVAPNFTLVDKDLTEVSLSDFKGQVVVITTFPSIDTSICAMQARKFNVEAQKLGDNVKILTVSLDLPFALGRFCAAEGLNNVKTLSDYKERELATKYSLLIDELKLLARTVYVIDKEGKIRYFEICENVKQEPNYKEALKVINELV